MLKKLIAFDLDGTLTQHHTLIDDENRAFLDELKALGYRLLMVSAGDARRVFEQLGGYPIEILGNYGMQYYVYNEEKNDIAAVYDKSLPCDIESVQAKLDEIREKFGFSHFVGERAEFFKSGCVAFPILGTDATLKEKLSFDPDRTLRQKILAVIKDYFKDYNVFIGGSNSFDMAPMPYDKYYALDNFCLENGIEHSKVIFAGDDYHKGGNDEPVYLSDIDFICVDNYKEIKTAFEKLLKGDR